ncbi:MAG: lactate utilization protein [Eggerthellaceae bacterium]|jgi:L-lactate utilization protein LutB
MQEFECERNRKLAEKVIKGLAARNMEGYFAETKEEALKIALGLIPEGSSVSWGGTFSIAEIGLRDALINGNYTVYDRDAKTTPGWRDEVMHKAHDCDFFLASSNAITEDGMLVNIDGDGNRVSCIAWGPKNVLMIIGMNKVTKDLDHALYRARNVAAPINAQRFDIKTPCKMKGACYDCKSPDTICGQFLITRHSMRPGRIKIILVNEVLGF